MTIPLAVDLAIEMLMVALVFVHRMARGGILTHAELWKSSR